MEPACGALFSRGRGRGGGGGSSYFFFSGERNCLKVTFLAGWHLSCKAENKSTHGGSLSSSRGSPGPNPSFDTLKTNDDDNKNQPT